MSEANCYDQPPSNWDLKKINAKTTKLSSYCYCCCLSGGAKDELKALCTLGRCSTAELDTTCESLLKER